jgi:PAS domain S-box-containing protein
VNKQNPSHFPYHIVLIYSVAGAVWILLSDLLVEKFVHPLHYEIASVAKGWLFIIVTAFLLGLLLRRYHRTRVGLERRLREIIDNLPSVLYVFDRDGRAVLLNRAMADLCGSGAEEPWEKSREELGIAPDAAAEQRANDLRVIEAGQPLVMEEQNPEADGLHTYLTVKFPLTGSDGSIEAVCGVSTDITERKRGEAELAVSESKYRLLSKEFQGLLDAMPDSLMLLGRGMKVLWANKAAVEGLGAVPEQLSDPFCCTECMNLGESCPVEQCFASGMPRDVTITRPDGRIWDIRTVPLPDEQGNVAKVIELKRDITEHTKLEAQYLHAQKMESIGTLAGGVAHDFNNILTAIIGYGQLMLMNMADSDPHRRNITGILEAADRATHLTRELLLFSRKQPSERKPVDLNEIIANMEKFLLRVISEDIVLKTVPHDAPLPVLADGNQLKQVLMNLAVNARDAMPHGGSFVLQAERVELREDFVAANGFGKPGVFALLTVADTGAGMDKGMLQRIFEPFFTTKEMGKGTGLGLAVVYGIVKQHDGFISVCSEPGQGTTFRVYLPLIAAAVRQEVVMQREQTLARGTETILLGEDDEMVRTLVTSVLTDAGYTVIVAGDGEEAVRKFREHADSIHLLLLDLIMPKMNGKEAFDEIRRIRPEIKTIFSSGYSHDIAQQKASLDDGSQLVFKPIAPLELLKKVRGMLDGKPLH